VDGRMKLTEEEMEEVPILVYLFVYWLINSLFGSWW
jgi:hypothetical protein